jgi:hypothetical protein
VRHTPIFCADKPIAYNPVSQLAAVFVRHAAEIADAEDVKQLSAPTGLQVQEQLETKVDKILRPSLLPTSDAPAG